MENRLYFTAPPTYITRYDFPELIHVFSFSIHTYFFWGDVKELHKPLSGSGKKDITRIACIFSRICHNFRSLPWKKTAIKNSFLSIETRHCSSFCISVSFSFLFYISGPLTCISPSKIQCGDSKCVLYKTRKENDAICQTIS